MTRPLQLCGNAFCFLTLGVSGYCNCNGFLRYSSISRSLLLPFSCVIMSSCLRLPTRVIRLCNDRVKQIEREGKLTIWLGLSILLLLEEVKHGCSFKLLLDYQLLGTVFSRNEATGS